MKFFHLRFGIFSLILFFLIFSRVSAFDEEQLKAHIDSVNATDHSRIFSEIIKYTHIFRQNIKDAQSINYREGEARATALLGLALYMKGDYDASLDAYLKAIRMMEELGLNRDLAIAYCEKGYQSKTRNLEQAKAFMRKGLSIARKYNYVDILKNEYNNYGVLMEMAGQLDSAEYYYEKSLELKKENYDLIGIPYSLNNLAILYSIKGDFSKAFQMLQESDSYRKREEGIYGKAVNATIRGDLYFHLAEYDSAIYNYFKVIKMPSSKEFQGMRKYCFERISECYKQKNDFKNAYLFLKRYEALKDSLINVETQSRIAELEIEYETEKKDRLLAENRLAVQKRNTMLVLSFIATFVFIVLSIGTYKFQRQKQKQLQRELELKLKIQQAEYKQGIFEEKLRIARELHDNIGSQLTVIISSLENLTYVGSRGKELPVLQRMTTFARQTLNDLRNTIWAMKNETNSLESLITKIRELKATITDVEIKILNNLDCDLKLNSTQLLNLLRITQEAIQNSLKHSRCSKIEVEFKGTENLFTLEVRDNGCGFDVESAKRNNGLFFMEQRCKSAGGTFSIHSDNDGTRVRCEVPM